MGQILSRWPQFSSGSILGNSLSTPFRYLPDSYRLLTARHRRGWEKRQISGKHQHLSSGKRKAITRMILGKGSTECEKQIQNNPVRIGIFQLICPPNGWFSFSCMFNWLNKNIHFILLNGMNILLHFLLKVQSYLVKSWNKNIWDAKSIEHFSFILCVFPFLL